MSDVVAVNEAAYELTEILESAPEAELAEGGSLMESVRDLLGVCGKPELLRQLHEAEGVATSLRELGCALSPATLCILNAAADRAERALERAEALGPQE